MRDEGKLCRKKDTCRRVAELIPWFIQGKLSDEEKVFVAGHLTSCPKCVSELRECVRVMRLVKREVCRLPAGPALRESERRLVRDIRRGHAVGESRGYFAWVATARILDLFASRIPPLKPVAAFVGLPLFLMNAGSELRRVSARHLRGMGGLLYGTVR